MHSFELSKLQGASAPRALSDSDRSQLDARTRSTAGPTQSPATRPGVAIEVGAASGDTSTPPVNSDRVQEIRKALKDGSYPLVPTKIADAIIAARISFEVDPQ